MNDKWEALNPEDDVVYFRQPLFEDSNHTQLLFEIINKIKAASCEGVSLRVFFEEGLDCHVLVPSKKWREGKIRLCVEFCSNEPEESDNSQQESEIEYYRQFKDFSNYKEFNN
ncbi:KGK domain-containing protein [Fischerella sp. JS2]|uniref:KGK domain-containing protein n=1 Tax=Fischerella sp. JS2 TaxID=2597771 RepID=UPI0028E875B9|nr:KGK domain-containing protein [Fischerella sp. JS2]